MNNARRCTPFFLLLLLLLPSPSPACSWAFQDPAYWYEYLNGPERDALLDGKVGIIDSDWADPGLYVAWRHFEGLGVPKELWPAFWLEGPESEYFPQEEEGVTPPPSAIDLWRAALGRAGIAEPSWPSNEISTEVPDGEGGTNWLFFVNCLDSAFKTAAITLDERRERWGAGSKELTEWLRGQEIVFERCSQPGEAAAELDAGWKADLRADRQYQIAAADFYSLRYEAAGERFRHIAADKTSPWAQAAAFAAARTTLRRGLFAQAGKEFRAILADNNLLDFHDSARRLLDYAELRAAPEKVAAQLEAELRAPKPPVFVTDKLKDVRWLVDKIEATKKTPLLLFYKSISNWRLPATAAYTYWQGNPSTTSLVVALIRASEWLDGKDVELPDVARLGKAENEALVAAAAKIGKDSPAYLSARYYRARLLAGLGRDEEGRKELDRLLDEKVGTTSDVQRLRHLRAHLARDWNELVAFGLLTPLGETDDQHSKVYQTDPKNYNSELEGDTRLLIPVAIGAINRFASLEDLAKLHAREELPRHYRRDLALAGFLRAALEREDTQAAQFADAAQALEPKLESLFAEWRAAEGSDSKLFAAVFLALHQPGLSIDLWPFWGRNTAREEIDSLRENWWCAAAELPADAERPAFLRGQEPPKENALAATSGPNLLGREVLAYAQKFADDPKLPEALHLTVRATRYGCYGEGYAEVSKAAFGLLHKRFPKSEWTAQTPYWFE